MRNSNIQFKATSPRRKDLRRGPFVIPLAFACLALSPAVQAVNPAPDGGNTAEGQNALLSLTTGIHNTAVGYLSLKSDTTGGYNTAVGSGTLLANAADGNTAIGTFALLSNTSGGLNTANGALALFSNTEGIRNSAVGFQALYNNTTGIQNTASGFNALVSNATGNNNVATGFAALYGNTAGVQNTADGVDALHNTMGSNNTATGFEALVNNTTGNTNTALGAFAGTNITTANNVICIGNGGQNVSNSCYIGSIFGQLSSGGTAVFINPDGKIGTGTSSKRFKEDIKPMDKASEALFVLKPVSLRYKKQIDPAGISQLGLVAEDVKKVNPDLVVRDKDGKPYSVRCDQVNAMLLNEFLKEHQKVEKLEATAMEQQKAIKALTASLKEQASQIQKVSVQLEVSKPAPQMVTYNQ